MKVYWIVTNYPHEAEPQAGVFYKHFAEQLIKLGVDLTVIAPTPLAPKVLTLISARWKKYNLAPKEEVVNGVKILRPRYFTIPGESKFDFPVKNMVESISKLDLLTPNVIHGFGGNPAGMVAQILSHKFSCKLIQTFIGSDVNDISISDTTAKGRLIQMCNNASAVFGVSKSLSDKIQKYTSINTEVMYMPMAPTSIHVNSRKELRTEFELKSDTFYVLFVGYLYESKGVKVLCDAMFQLIEYSDIQAIFCGGETELKKDIDASSNSKYIGQLSNAQVLELMACCDVLVLPSYNEGIPGVIKEAAISSLPVIATNVGGIPEVIDETTGYLVNVGDSNALAEKILFVKNNHEISKLKSQVLKDKVFNMFEAENIAQKQLSVYKSIIEKA